MDDYDPGRFHDNQIHGIAFRTADPDEGDWTSELVLDIDHIVEWIKVDAGVRFRVQPADLIFHDVTDLRLRLDGVMDGFSVAIALPWILQIDREPAPSPSLGEAPGAAKGQGPAALPLRPELGAPGSGVGRYRWSVVLSSTPSGEIQFGASGYTLALRGKAVVQDEQGLQRDQRAAPASE